MGSLGSFILSKLIDSIRSQHVNQTQSQTLKPGQIVTGKVLQLYPNQRALVQLGNQQMNAQLEASLTLNNRYWFQVQSNDQLVNLKVLSEAKVPQGQENSSSLLSTLELVPTKNRIAFLKELSQQNVPFQKGELKEALKIIDQFGSHKEVKNVLFDMLNRKLPINRSIFQALYQRTINQTTITSSIESLKNESSARLSVLNELQQLQQPPKTTIEQALRNSLTNNMVGGKSTAFSLFQKANLIPNEQSANEWNQRINEWVKVNDLASNKTRVSTINQLPFEVTNEQDFARKLLSLFQNQLPVKKGDVQLLRQWNEQVQKLLTQPITSKSEVNVTQASLNKMTETIQSRGLLAKLIPFLNQANMDESQLNQLFKQVSKGNSNMDTQIRNQLQAVQQNLQLVLNQQLSSKESRLMYSLLASVQNDHPQLLQNEAEQFLLQLKGSVHRTGLNYESQLFQQANQENITRPDPSLKGMVLQMLQDSSGTQMTEKLQSILHQLNGMVLSSQETDKSINLHFQLPGEWFGIKQDLVIDLEGRKTEKDEVDPAYCNILFYLQLESLKETVIDMRVQKRIVQLTLYTEHEEAGEHIKTFKPLLEDGLKKLDYTLSSVRHKAISNTANESTIKPSSNQQQQGGFDYRI